MKISRLSKVSEEKVETDLSDMYDQLPKLIKLTNDDEAILNKLIEVSVDNDCSPIRNVFNFGRSFHHNQFSLITHKSK